MTYLKSESGAVTVDWVVLTAALVGLGLATMSVVSSGVEDISTDIDAALQSNNIIKTSFETINEELQSATDRFYQALLAEEAADPNADPGWADAAYAANMALMEGRTEAQFDLLYSSNPDSRLAEAVSMNDAAQALDPFTVTAQDLADLDGNPSEAADYQQWINEDFGGDTGAALGNIQAITERTVARHEVDFALAAEKGWI